MRKTYWLTAICSMALIALLATCQKKQASDRIEKVTYSKNFNNSVTDANIWIDFNFEVTHALSNQEIAASKLTVESYYTNYLVAHQIQKHEVYFKWINLSAEPLRYRLIGYVTPTPTNGATHRDSGTMTSSDPPKPPPPPPPPMS